MRWPLVFLCLVLAACGGTQKQSTLDEDALVDRVTERVLARLEEKGVTAGSETEPESPRGPSPAAAHIEPAERAPDAVDRRRVPAEGAPARGAEQPLVTIVTFSDFECPFCARAAPTIDKLVDTYPNEVQLVFRHNPLPMHRDAKPAANAAIEVYAQAGAQAFWKYHDLLFDHSKDLGLDALAEYAKGIEGVNPAQVRRAAKQRRHSSVIERDQKLARRLGARGTPAFFINGRKLMGAQPFAKFEQLVEEEIAFARRLMNEGTKRAQLYKAFMRSADRKPAPQPRRPRARKRKVPDPNAIYDIPVDDEPRRGPRHALVTLVEFGDFQCPFCERVQPTLDKIRQEYGNKVRIVWKNNPLPFHDGAMPAAIAAHEVYEQGGHRKFWQYHDLLFENQKSLGEDNLKKWARQIGGIHMGKFRRALENDEHKERIQKQQQLARDRGARGTPGFFINGRHVGGAQPFSEFKKVIDEELERAKKLLKQGTPRRKIYEKAIEDGATTPQKIEKGGDPQAGTPSPQPDTYEVPVPEDAPRKGDPDAPLVIQIFSDFQCPFCKRAVPTIERVLEEYEGQVQVVFRHYPLPFHQHAMPAARASIEVYEQQGDEAFWKYHDLLFENSKSLSRSTLERLANRVDGIDMDEFGQALDQDEHRARVKKDQQAVKDAGMRIGTPSFLIDGHLLQGAQPFSKFKSMIDAQLQGDG
jgi:protein-disulfide isomerase